jgi:hypothetical protein
MPNDQNGDPEGVFLDRLQGIVEQGRDKRLPSPSTGQRKGKEIMRRTDTRLIIVPNVHTLLRGIFSIFPILLPFYLPALL